MKKSSDLFTEQRFSRMRESRGTKSRDHLYRIMALAAVVRTECLSVPRYTNCWWWKVKANHVSRWTSLNADGSLKIVLLYVEDDLRYAICSNWSVACILGFLPCPRRTTSQKITRGCFLFRYLGV